MEHKFKVGDKVCCVGVSSRHENAGCTNYGNGGKGWKIGRVFTIKCTTKSHNHRTVYWDRVDDYGVYENHLELYNKGGCKKCKYRLKCLTA